MNIVFISFVIFISECKNEFPIFNNITKPVQYVQVVGSH